MKAIVLLFIGFLFSFSINAQNTFNLKELPEIDFDTIWHADTSRLLSLVPKFKLEPPQEYSFSSGAPENLYGINSNKKNLAIKKYLSYTYKMPVIKPSGNNWNMPIHIPDSTVNYFIRELRIGAIDEIIEPEK
jgi:hypothetical protein